MNGKYMNIKKLIIPTLTMVIIASQLMGCAAASQSELLQMINNGEQIEIEIATPKTEEQGEESTLLWEELAYLTTNPDLRAEWDSILGITGAGDSKNGIFYVDAEGNHDLNNTLKTVIHNQEFTKLLADENTTLSLANASLNQYADLDPEDTTKSLYMGINGYFNLLPDNTPNYSNPDSTLTRAEFLTLVMRSETPVSEIETDDTFTEAVGESEYNKYAQELSNANYLDTKSKSLNNMTYNGTITRAEAIYLLMNHYFPDELAAVAETKSADLTDAKDGGNIAEQQKFIESGTPKDYWKSYELTYALQNPDQGLPTSLYNALVLANSKGILPSETRWDEGLTKAEAVEFLVETLKQDTSINGFNYKQGIVEGLEASDTETEEITKAPGIDSPDLEYEEKYMVFTEIEPTIMYAVKDGVGYDNPNKFEGALRVGMSLSVADNKEYVITHTGEYIGEGEQKGTVYYAFKTDLGSFKIIEQDLLSTEKTQPADTNTDAASEDTNNTTNNNNNETASNDNTTTTPPPANNNNGPDPDALKWLEEQEANINIEASTCDDINNASAEDLDAADGMFIQ